jgi:nuclear pore complex protein Nup93
MLDSIDLLPTGSDLVQIIRKSEQVKDLDDTIVKNLDVIVLSGMNILYQVFSTFKDSPYGDASRQAVSVLFCFPNNYSVFFVHWIVILS